MTEPNFEISKNSEGSLVLIYFLNKNDVEKSVDSFVNVNSVAQLEN